MNSNFKQISHLLAEQAENIAKYLLPNGKKYGYEWCCGNTQGDTGKSLKVCLAGEKSGVFCDFATGESGDLLDLWSLSRNINLSEALKEAKQFLGIRQPSFEGYKQKQFSKPILPGSPNLNISSIVMRYLMNERKLNLDTIQAFKIREDKELIVFPYWRGTCLIFIKYLSAIRINNKKQISVAPNCEPCLFGWQALQEKTREITITEGEIDAMSLHQYGIPALSVPFGGGIGKKQDWVEYEFERLSEFDQINLCLDNDTQGNAAVSELVERLGRHRCRIVKLPYKDANECLQAGVTANEIRKCFNEARSLDPEELKPASSYVQEVIDEFYPVNGSEVGIPPPWDKVKGKILFRPEELSIWGGINGHGKSQFLGHIILSSLRQNAKVCIASLEIKPRKLLMRMTRQASSLKKPTESHIRAIHEWFGDRLWLFDLVGTTKADRLLEVFLYARQRYGISIFVIDSFMKCGIDEEDFKSQKAFIEKLCDFKNEHSCHIHLIVHPRKSNDEFQVPGKLDIKGTGAITDLADNCFMIWRNKKKEEVIQVQATGNTLSADQLKRLVESDCIWRCDKQRNGEWEGKVALWFDSNSFQYLESCTARSIPFVQYSSEVK